MKKIMAMMVGLGLMLGTAAMFAQAPQSDDQKQDTTKKKKKKGGKKKAGEKKEEAKPTR